VSLERLFLAAWLEELNKRTPAPAVRRVGSMAEWVRLDDTGRAPIVPLRPAHGPR
jgi:hypothetical protein